MSSPKEGALPIVRSTTRLLRRRSTRLAWFQYGLRRSKPALAGLVVLLTMIFAAALAPVLSPHEPNAVDILVRLQPPAVLPGGDWVHPLGTDQLGRDLLTRLLYGGRVSFTVGFATATVAAALGLTLGLVSGYFGGLLDEAVMRVGDIFLAFPFLLLAMVAIMVLGPGLANMILVLSIFGWVATGRVVRADTLLIREQDFVSAARVVGCRDTRIIVRHILPNVLAPMIVLFTFAVASVIIAEASLSFLGLGIPPAIPSWGMMLSDGRNVIRDAPWMATLPGLCITLAVLSLNLVGDWLRDQFDPRLRNS